MSKVNYNGDAIKNTLLPTINSALEATVDLVTIERKPLAKIAKDCASGATLIFSIMSLIIGIIIFIL